MRMVKQEHKTEWVLQAYLAVNPSHPQWSDVSFEGVVDWLRFQKWNVPEKGKLWSDPRLAQDRRGWSFVSAEAGASVLNDLLAAGQNHWLRVVERKTYVDEWVVSGFEIEDGTVVRDPKGVFPKWMGKPVEGCRPNLPVLTKDV